MTTRLSAMLWLSLSWFYANPTINADAQTLQSSISSGAKTVDQTMDGTTAGIGIKRINDSGTFVRLEYAETDYDKISITTTNSTKITADAENTRLTLSIGKSF